MNDNKLEKVLLSEQIKQKLINMIIEGDLKPGDRLIESKIAKNFGVSQAPVREALKELSLINLVYDEPYKGSSVSRFTKNEFIDFMNLRNCLEVLAAQLASKNITDQDIKNLENLNREIIKAAEEKDFQKSSELNGEFHESIIILSNNNFLIELSVSLGFQSWSAITSKYTKMDQASIENNHKTIINCLKDQDLNRIKETITNHNENIFNNIDFDFYVD